MKRTKFMTIKAAIVLIMVIVTSTSYTTNVYLENSYGAKLKYILGNPNQSPREHELGINLRSDSLGELYSIPRLYIRTTGKGSGYGLSPYNDLDYYLAQIKMQEDKHPNSDAIINISSSYGKWNITVYWEKIGLPIQTFSIKKEALAAAQATKEKTFMDLQSATARLEGIKTGLLGEDYAEKAREICSADYSVAKNKGMINLCDQLQRTLVEMPYAKAPLKPGMQAPNIKPTIDEIKNSIDLLSRALKSYRAKGNAS